MNGVGVDYGVRRVALACTGTRWTDYRPDVAELVLAKKKYPLGEDNDGPAHEALYAFVLERIAWWRPGFVALESPVQGASVNVKTGLRLAMIAGVLSMACTHAGAATVFVAPARWKKQVVGVGNASKDQVADWLERAHPEQFSLCATQDAIDAMCMALYAEGKLAG